MHAVGVPCRNSYSKIHLVLIGLRVLPSVAVDTAVIVDDCRLRARRTQPVWLRIFAHTIVCKRYRAALLCPCRYGNFSFIPFLSLRILYKFIITIFGVVSLASTRFCTRFQINKALKSMPFCAWSPCLYAHFHAFALVWWPFFAIYLSGDTPLPACLFIYLILLAFFYHLKRN